MTSEKYIPRYQVIFERIKVGCSEVHSFPLHWHSFYEFEFVIKGEGEQIINGTPCSYKKGDVFLLGPTDFHERILKDSVKIWIIQIPLCNMPAQFYNNGFQNCLPVKATLTDADYNALEVLLEMLAKYSEFENSQDQMLSESILNTILLFILNAENQTIQNKPNNRIGMIYSYLQEHFLEKISIEDMAKQMGFHPKYLCTYFKKHTGRTITGSIREMRLVHASHQVIASDKNIQEIGLLCGYNSASFFLRDFKKRFGITPSQMREKVKA